MMLPFSIFRAAVLAEPSVTEIEEVICLVHGTAGGDPAPTQPTLEPTPEIHVVAILE